MKRVYVNEKWCLGCHLCEYYCAFADTNEDDMARALKDIKINPKIKIEEQAGIYDACDCNGSYDGENFIQNDSANVYKKLYYKNDTLKGYILIGNVHKAGIYTTLIREQTSLSSIDFNLICKSPSLMAFSKEERDIKLGGAK